MIQFNILVNVTELLSCVTLLGEVPYVRVIFSIYWLILWQNALYL